MNAGGMGHRPHGRGAPERERAGARRATEESEFCSYQWTGQRAADEFFKLHANPAFGGTGATGVVLPPNSLSVSRRATVGNSVINAYANGLEYAEQVFSAGGFMLFGFVVFGYLTVLLITMLPDVGGVLFPSLVVLCLVGLWFMFRFDTVGYRYTPVLFNRALGKVHVFRDQTRFWSLWPLWGGGAHRVDSYEWSCVRAQISRFRVFTGNVAQDSARLGCIVLKAPDRAELVAEFPLGVTTSALAIQNLLDHWEHVRRYMEYEGPMFPEGEEPYKEVTTQSLLGAVFFGQPFIGPGAKEAFVTTDMGVSFVLVVWQILALFLFPVTLTIGLLRWASLRIRTKPKWPVEVLASVGGKVLNGDELNTWRGVIPEKPGRVAQSVSIVGNSETSHDT